MNNRLPYVPLAFLPFALVLFAACGGDAPPPSRTSAPKAAAPTALQVIAREKRALQEAQQQFESLCVTCHGNHGHGDGPGAGPLNPKPRSFADIAWQDSVTDEQIQKTIVFGGAAVGKSPLMPSQPQFKGRTDLLDGLVKVVRGFRGKP